MVQLNCCDVYKVVWDYVNTFVSRMCVFVYAFMCVCVCVCVCVMLECMCKWQRQNVMYFPF